MDANSNELAQVASDVLQISGSADGMAVGMLERALLEAFPEDDACEWDRTGLLVGDPFAKVDGVSVALDASVDAIRVAANAGTNVLVTHHPPYLEPPLRLRPAESGGFGPEAVSWEAVRQGVALMCFHTALDASPLAARILPSMLSLEYCAIADPLPGRPERGFGQVCTVRQGEGLSLAQLAARCVSVFGRLPRVYGAASSMLSRVVTCTGSAGELAPLCVAAGYDCLVCGEIKYHAAIDAANAGLCIVELGHDVSEIPLCTALAAAVERAGIPGDMIKVIDQAGTWWTPEAVRR